jgi:putative transport protein
MLRPMIEFLVEQPLMLLFGVLAFGYAAGRVKVGGVSLGVAAVLFVGLAAGSLDPRLQLPELVQRFGLVLFVYTVGIASGPGFFASFRRRGLRDALFTMSMLGSAAALVALAYRVLGFGGPRAGGLFAGALTNTPALAGVLERLRGAAHGDEKLLAEPVVAYSLAYPMGVLGIILVLAVVRGRWKKELSQSKSGSALDVHSVRVLDPAACDRPLAQLQREHGWHAVFARRRRGDHVTVMNTREPLQVGDLITVVATPEEIARIVDEIGEPAEEQIELDRTDLDFRRVFVSDPSTAGRPLKTLQLLQRFGALVTRVRRGDLDLLPDPNMTLELGDRVRVLGPRPAMKDVAAFFGDSYRALAEVDVLSFGLGITAGLLLGLIPIPLPGGGTFQIGVAGGPLLVGLALGALGRTGPVVWQLPYSANLTLRQIGITLFLAGVGTRSGWVFAQALKDPNAIALVLAGAVVTMTTTSLSLIVGRKLLRIPAAKLFGMVTGIHTQPAALAFAAETAGDDGPNAGYAAVFPFATISKILLAQLLVEVLK